MGFLDKFRLHIEGEEKGELKKPDVYTKRLIDQYIKENEGIPYIPVEQQIAEKKIIEEAKRKAEEAKKVKEGSKQEKPLDNSNNTSGFSEGVRYSLPTIEDMTDLSREADEFFEIGDPNNLFRAKVPRIKTEVMNFTDLLRFYINNSGMSNVEIYSRANLSKSVFSALFAKSHLPKKGTIVALAIALGLDLRETERLLMKAGYTFSNSIKGDLIAVYFINHRIYDIDKLNGALYEYGEPILGSKSY